MKADEISTSGLNIKSIRTRAEREEFEKKKEEELMEAAGGSEPEVKTEDEKFLNFFTKAVKKKQKEME